MIQLSDVTKSFGDRILLDHVTWQIGDGDRVGLCGPNGAGKTTLLRMLARFDEPDSGEVVTPSTLTIGYLPQDGLNHAGRSVFEEASAAFQPLLDAQAEMTDIEHRLADPSVPLDEHETMLTRYSELQDRFRLGEGYSIELRVATVLRGLGFSQEDLERRTETFSGGWQMRIALAKLLLGRPNLLLLDEPTNHLDLDARNWLEEYLGSYPFAVILVSHDRYFLDSVVTRITDLNLRKLTDYVGNYSKYVMDRDAMLERLRTAKREQDEEVARVKMFIDRFRYQATKAAQVQSRIKALEKVVPIEVPPERKRIHFTFPTCAKSGRTVMTLEHVHKAYADIIVFNDVSLHIERGDRIALLGPNGAGKSTLMRMLSSEEDPDGGTRTLGHQVVMEYFAQDEATRLDPALTVYETLEAASATQMVPMIRNILGGFLFSGDDVYKKAGVLSGGERTRLAVARMLLRPSNTLLLDEPTNHLDLESKDVLLEALEDYGGTLIFVSHDRYFVEKLANKIIEIGHGQATVYPGTYAEFLWHKEQTSGSRLPATGSGLQASGSGLQTPGSSRREGQKPKAGPKSDARSQKAEARSPKSEVRSPTSVAGSPKPDAASLKPVSREDRKRDETERRKRDKDRRALQSRIVELEARIAAREAEVREIEATMSDPGFYENHETSRPVIDRHQALMWEVGDLMGQWEALQAHAADHAPES